MNQRPPEPREVTEYHLWQKNGPPKCCHTCDWYSGKGTCLNYDMRPPVEFTQTFNACEDWMLEIPF